MKKIKIFFLIFLCSLIVPSLLEAKKYPPPDEMTMDLTGNQPYAHQWFESTTKKNMSVMGQTYRPRPNLVVMEMFALPQNEAEIQSVKIRTADGKVYEGKIRRLPWGFMPQARRNYQTQTRLDSEVKA